MTRNEAFKILEQKLANKNLIKHSLAVEAIMRALARHFGQEEEKWGMVGLLHDIDYEEVKNDLSRHGEAGARILKDLGLSDEICQAVKLHNEAQDRAETLLEKAIYVSDPISGLIVASALVLTSKKLTDLTVENVLNRFSEKGFAKGANRQIIAKCQNLLGLELPEFVKICLEAMQKISADLGL